MVNGRIMHEFTPPGHGEWALDRSHYPEGTTPISQWLISESMRAGMTRVFAEVGVPAECIASEFVNGFMYTRMRPLIGADKKPRKPPPAPILKLAARLHPAFRARAKAATRTLEDKEFRNVVKRWETELRPGLLEANGAFQEAQPNELDDTALQLHVSALLDHARETFELHFWLHGYDLGPIAKYVHDCLEWGLDPYEAIEALDGASPSTTRPMERLRELRKLVDEADAPIDSLDDVRAVSAEASVLLDTYLEDYGSVLATGYDITCLTLGEMPATILGSIRSAKPASSSDFTAHAARLREQVPASARAEFDESLSDARLVMDMRDDNGPQTVQRPIGLLRRALLAAGDRLADRGALADPLHVLELTPSEARRMFADSFPSAEDLAGRAATRQQLALLDPPATLGDPEPAPPADVLPKPLDRLVAMVTVAMKYMGMDADARPDPLTGAGVGTEPFQGVARVASSANEAIENLEPGDVLVVRATSPAFNSVLAVAGAVVTADGGALSHAAVMARELGIPAVIGASGALDIADGAMVEVNPTAGTVRVL